MIYNKKSGAIEMSVRELCHAAYLFCDIDCRRHGGRADDFGIGSAAHRRVQAQMGDSYHAEVSLSCRTRYEGILFDVKGRADGVFIAPDGIYVVDEIKTERARQGSSVLESLYSAQLYCYCYFLCSAKGLDGVYARLTYYDLDDGEIRYSQKYVSAEELRASYAYLLSASYFRASLMLEKYEKRMPTAKDAVFPYAELRDAQRDMIRECYLDMKHGSRLFCQAPTGIGKTVSTLYPAVRVMGEGISDKIFYLTSKASIRREAYHAAEAIRQAGADIRTVVISSREQACICPKDRRRFSRLSSNCRPDICPYAEGYYSRRDEAISWLIDNGNEYHRDRIREAAEKFKVCPYELSLDLSEVCDIIICDYNYVFSPLVYLRRYFGENRSVSDKYIFLVDEAHNLPSRARDIFSSRLLSSDFSSLFDLSAAYYENETNNLCLACKHMSEQFELLRALCSDNTRVDGEQNEYGYYISRDMREDFFGALSKFMQKCEAWLYHNEECDIYFAVENIMALCREYKEISERYDGHYITYISFHGKETSVLLICLDPSKELSDALDLAASSVLFSATLTPAEYFADILGGGERSVSVSFQSPYPPENLCVAVVDSVSTRYEDRAGSYKKIASYIAAALSAKKGNYIAFFPSYSYMEEVKKVFCAKYPSVKMISQSRDFTLSEKERFLDFFADDEKLRIGFCVMGSSFSEGIDLPGKRLIGTVIVGVGLPGISDERNIMRDYYEEKYGAGYDYAYTYPGMNSVLQAAGRVIRREEDRGIVVLIDDRYAEPKYRELLPDSWKEVKCAGNPSSLAEIARRFWQNGEK